MFLLFEGHRIGNFDFSLSGQLAFFPLCEPDTVSVWVRLVPDGCTEAKDFPHSSAIQAILDNNAKTRKKAVVSGAAAVNGFQTNSVPPMGTREIGLSSQ